jgi:hypothetical protein
MDTPRKDIMYLLVVSGVSLGVSKAPKMPPRGSAPLRMAVATVLPKVI